jgi:hypothetical protein
MCKNKYLLKKRKYYFPFHDETPFNICLWKRNATQSLGYVFVNTHLLSTVQLVEENNITDKQLGTIIDGQGADWEYIHNSSDVIFYHGFKEPKQTEVVLDFLLNR